MAMMSRTDVSAGERVFPQGVVVEQSQEPFWEQGLDPYTYCYEGDFRPVCLSSCEYQLESPGFPQQLHLFPTIV